MFESRSEIASAVDIKKSYPFCSKTKTDLKPRIAVQKLHSFEGLVTENGVVLFLLNFIE